MKKLICITVATLCVLFSSGCSKTLKSENMDITVTMPEGGWKVESDDAESFVIGKKNNLITYTNTDVPEGYSIPKTQDELAAIAGEAVMAVSKIEDWNYTESEDGKTQKLYYVQTISAGEQSSVMVNCYKIENNKLMTAMATLTDTDKSEEIKEIIKNF